MAETAQAPATEPAPVQTGPDLSWVDNFGLDDVAKVETPLPGAAQGAAAEPPKQAVATDDPAKTAEPVKAVEGEKKEPAPEPVVEKKAEAAAEAVAKPEIKDDPELTKEDNELIRTRPAAEQPELTDRLKKASFINQFKDPEVPAKGTVEALRKISPSSYARVETEIIDQRLAEPAPFLDELFTRDPDKYGTLALEVFKGNPEYFAEQLTGKKGVAPETVKTAFEFYELNKDRKVEQPAVEELPAEIIERIKLYLGEDEAAKVEAAVKRARETSAPATATQPTPKLKTEEPKVAAAEPKAVAKTEPKAKEPQLTAEQQLALQAQKDETWEAASGQIESYLETWADDPKDGLGLKVTPQERELAPAVADLKDFKKAVLFRGLGDLPNFREGLLEWGKPREDFMKKLGIAGHFADLGEKDNAIEAARALLPFVEKYKQERMNAPIFARLDAQIKAAAAKTNPKTESETIIPGAVGASSPPPTSDPYKRIDDLLLSDAMAAG